MARAKGTISRTGRAPYGYRAIKRADGKHWEQIPSEVATVREMYDLSAAQNFGFKQIAVTLNGSGSLTRSGTQWGAYTIQYILTNESLVGTLVKRESPTTKGHKAKELARISDYFPSILSQDEWGKLEERLAIRREHPWGRVQGSGFLLSGIARCGHCGGSMVGCYGSPLDDGTGYEHLYYRCSKALISKELCEFRRFYKAEIIEDATVGFLRQFTNPSNMQEYQHPVKSSTGHVNRLNREQDNSQNQTPEEALQERLEMLDLMVMTKVSSNRARSQRAHGSLTRQQKNHSIQAPPEEQQMISDTLRRLTSKVDTFLEVLESHDLRNSKSLLQLILKQVRVYQRGGLELEIRVKTSAAWSLQGVVGVPPSHDSI